MSNLNDIAKSNPNLANNPYLRGLRFSNNSSNTNDQQSQRPIRTNNNSQNKNKKPRSCENKDNEWIIQLFEAKASNATGQKQIAYKKAIRNIKKTPFSIRNEHTAKSVTGIGDSLAKIIKQKLISLGLYLSQDPNQARANARKQIEKHKAASKPKKNKKKEKQKANGPWVPKTRSGGYAILVQLYESYTHGVQGLSKLQLITDAQQYTDSSFTEAKNNYYTAWSSCTKCQNVGYVQSIRHGNKGNEYYLTEAGKAIAAGLHAKEFNKPIPSQPNRSIFSDEAMGQSHDHNVGQDEGNKKKEKKKYKCAYCAKSYVQESSYKKHLETKHKDGDTADNVEKRSAYNRKRKKDDTNEEIQPSAKRQRIEMNGNMKGIKINGGLYELCLVYDTSEERRKNRNEKVTLEKEFKRHDVKHRPYRLPVGDFCWTLIDVYDDNQEYLYPIIVERKRMDDLSKSIKDKRYQEQKWRIKTNCAHFRHIYLIEEYRIESESAKKQIVTSLINTEIRDKFFIFHTKSFIECINVLSKWTQMIYEEILNKLDVNKYNDGYDFFRSEQCLSFESFNTSMNVKKNINIPAKILFGRQLMAIPGVTDMIAAQIILKYVTLRHLYNAWDDAESEEEAKLLLYNVVNGTCLEWHRDLDSGLIQIDHDLRSACRAMDDTTFKPISKGLSEKIWNSFYNVT